MWLGGKTFVRWDSSNYSSWTMYFPKETMKSEQLELYTSLNLLADIGGYVGITLGLSLWNFAQWITDFINMRFMYHTDY